MNYLKIIYLKIIGRKASLYPLLFGQLIQIQKQTVLDVFFPRQLTMQSIILLSIWRECLFKTTPGDVSQF